MSSPRSAAFDDDRRRVVPDGLTIRRRRRRRGWSRRDLVAAIARASESATGRPDTIPPSLLQGVEEENEPVAYAVLCLIAAGLDCTPVEILGDEPDAEPADAAD